MIWRACKNYVVKAFSNLWRNLMTSFMATAVIVACLVLLGISLVFGFNINYISDQLKGDYEIHAYVDLSYSEADAKNLRSDIECVEFIKSAEFVSKEQALADMETEMMDSASAFEMLHGEENPLPHTFDITLTDVNQADYVVKAVSEIPGIDDVKNRSDILEKLVAITRAAQLAAVFAMLLFAVISIFIISYAIKTSVMSRSREIEIMKYVGATDWYIRWPFVIEGTIMGVFGAVIAFLPVYFTYDFVYTKWTEMDLINLFGLISPGSLWLVTLLVFLAMGIVLGAVGSVLSIRKHLKV